MLGVPEGSTMTGLGRTDESIDPVFKRLPHLVQDFAVDLFLWPHLAQFLLLCETGLFSIPFRFDSVIIPSCDHVRFPRLISGHKSILLQSAIRS
jgi:hypothetical protein